MSYIGNTPDQQAFTPAVDFFNGDGSTVAFTLSKPVASVAQVQAVISNVPQNPDSAYTVSGNTITFTSAPPSGTSNIYVYYTSPITQVIAPGQGTVTTTSLIDGSVTPAKLSTGGPSWDTSGNVTLTGNITLNNGTADGAQLILASSGYSDWNWDNYNGSLRAYNGATERLRLNTSGTVILQGGNTSATGVGITFPASQSASSDANTLDDYEEGTFTPVLKFGGATTGITYNSQRGTYTKIGNTVTIQIGIYLSNSGSATGAMTIDGLPFVSKNQAFGSYGGELFYGQSSFGSVTGVVFGLVNENSSTIYGYIQNNGVESQLQKANIAAYFQFKTTYQVA